MSDYDAADDTRKSWLYAYEAIRERVRNGGPTWIPKLNFAPDADGHQRREDDAATGGPDKSQIPVRNVRGMSAAAVMRGK